MKVPKVIVNSPPDVADRLLDSEADFRVLEPKREKVSSEAEGCATFQHSRKGGNECKRLKSAPKSDVGEEPAKKKKRDKNDKEIQSAGCTETENDVEYGGKKEKELTKKHKDDQVAENLKTKTRSEVEGGEGDTERKVKKPKKTHKGKQVEENGTMRGYLEVDGDEGVSERRKKPKDKRKDKQAEESEMTREYQEVDGDRVGSKRKCKKNPQDVQLEENIKTKKPKHKHREMPEARENNEASDVHEHEQCREDNDDHRRKERQINDSGKKGKKKSQEAQDGQKRICEEALVLKGDENAELLQKGEYSGRTRDKKCQEVDGDDNFESLQPSKDDGNMQRRRKKERKIRDGKAQTEGCSKVVKERKKRQKEQNDATPSAKGSLPSGPEPVVTLSRECSSMFSEKGKSKRKRGKGSPKVPLEHDQDTTGSQEDDVAFLFSVQGTQQSESLLTSQQRKPYEKTNSVPGQPLTCLGANLSKTRGTDIGNVQGITIPSRSLTDKSLDLYLQKEVPRPVQEGGINTASVSPLGSGWSCALGTEESCPEVPSRAKHRRKHLLQDSDDAFGSFLTSPETLLPVQDSANGQVENNHVVGGCSRPSTSSQGFVVSSAGFSLDLAPFKRPSHQQREKDNLSQHASLSLEDISSGDFLSQHLAAPLSHHEHAAETLHMHPENVQNLESRGRSDVTSEQNGFESRKKKHGKKAKHKNGRLDSPSSLSEGSNLFTDIVSQPEKARKQKKQQQLEENAEPTVELFDEGNPAREHPNKLKREYNIVELSEDEESCARETEFVMSVLNQYFGPSVPDEQCQAHSPPEHHSDSHSNKPSSPAQDSREIPTKAPISASHEQSPRQTVETPGGPGLSADNSDASLFLEEDNSFREHSSLPRDSAGGQQGRDTSPTAGPSHEHSKGSSSPAYKRFMEYATCSIFPEIHSTTKAPSAGAVEAYERSTGLSLRTNHFSPDEDEILKRNYRHITKFFDLQHPHLILGHKGTSSAGERQSAKKQISKWKILPLLAKDLPRRTLRQVYRRARALFHPMRMEHPVTFTDEESDHLLALYQRLGPKWHEIEKIMEKPADSLRIHFVHLEGMKPGVTTPGPTSDLGRTGSTGLTGLGRGRWEPEEEMRLQKAMDKFGHTDSSGRLPKGVTWETIAQEVGTRGPMQCYKRWSYASRNTENTKAHAKVWNNYDTIHLINEMYHMETLPSNDGDWNDIAKRFPVAKKGSILSKKWRQLVNANVPSFRRTGPKECAAYLYKHHLPSLLSSCKMSIEQAVQLSKSSCPPHARMSSKAELSVV